MPSFVLSSVDTSANTLTSTGVAAAGQPLGAVLQTGDRFRLRNVGGALPAATPLLVSTTDYFAIRVSDDVVKIADTNAHAHALAGTGIVDITGAGSGTTTIEFGLPYCLPTATAGPGTQIKSVDQNGAWAALVALYNLLTGQAQAVWSVIKLAMSLVITGDLTVGGDVHYSGAIDRRHGTQTMPIALGGFVGNGTYSGSPASLSVANGDFAYANIPLPDGERITAIRVTLTSNVNLSAVFALQSITSGTGVTATIATSSASSGSGSQVLPITSLTTQVTAGTSYQIRVACVLAAAVGVFMAEVDYDHLGP